MSHEHAHPAPSPRILRPMEHHEHQGNDAPMTHGATHGAEHGAPAAGAAASAHAQHGGHDKHAGHDPEAFRRQFWAVLLLTIPVVIWSEEVQHWLGYVAPSFPGSEWIPPILGTLGTLGTKVESWPYALGEQTDHEA